MFNREDYISIEEAQKLLAGSTGKPTLESVQRWAKYGVSGQKLRTIVIGSGRLTTPAWLSEFVGRVTEARNGESTPETT